MSTDNDMHRAAALCLECAIDRYCYLGSVNASDECATACTAAATDLLTDGGDLDSKSATLMRCAYACDVVAVDSGRDIEQYAECARLCWHLASESIATRLGV